jgi:tetratricopeptide (TPR) repeat protein
VPQTAQDLIAEAEQAAARLVASFPESPEALILMGTVYSRFGDSAKAIDCWEECLKRDPENAEADYHLGIAAKTQGEYETAAGHLQKASAGNPRLAGVHAVLGECLMCLGRAEEAAALLRKATETDAATAQDFFILGQALLQLQEHEKAKGSFQAALDISLDYPFAYYGLFRACAGLGQTEEAEQYRERFESFKLKGGMPAPVQEHQDDLKQVGKIVADFLRIAGLIHFNHAQADCAEELWRRAAVLDPDNPAPRQLLAALFRSQGRQEEALQVLHPGQTAATESQEKFP